jgi:hypothetical protein
MNCTYPRQRGSASRGAEQVASARRIAGKERGEELRQDDVELGEPGRPGRLDLGGYGVLVALFDAILEAVPSPIGLLEP